MFTQIDWGFDLAAPEPTNDVLGLESFTTTLDQGPAKADPFSFFKPVNITVEDGLYYATLYVCETCDGMPAAQQIAIWLSTLKETDHVHLTVGSFLSDIPLPAIVNLLGAFASTKAKIDIHLDQVVCDGLAYIYLLADTVTKGSEGALFIPSYVDQREQDKSGPWKAAHDFYKWIVEDAVVKNILTQEEANKLHRGSHVILPQDRFSL